MSEKPPHVGRRSVWRALRFRCPRCGRGRVLKTWFSHHPTCSECGLAYVPDPVDLGMFLYVSTAAFTGLFVIAYFLIGFPSTGWVRAVVGTVGLGLMVATAPLRRSLGIGLIYAAEVLFAPDDEK